LMMLFQPGIKMFDSVSISGHGLRWFGHISNESALNANFVILIEPSLFVKR
jgi:hypothetical protein